MLPFELACNFYAIMKAIQKGWLLEDWFATYITDIPSMITTDFFTKKSRLNYIQSIKIRFCMQKTYKQKNSINDKNLNTVIENIAILGNNKPKSNTIRQRKRKKMKEQRRRLNLAKKHEKMSNATFN